MQIIKYQGCKSDNALLDTSFPLLIQHYFEYLNYGWKIISVPCFLVLLNVFTLGEF